MPGSNEPRRNRADRPASEDVRVPRGDVELCVDLTTEMDAHLQLDVEESRQIAAEDPPAATTTSTHAEQNLEEEEEVDAPPRGTSLLQQQQEAPPHHLLHAAEKKNKEFGVHRVREGRWRVLPFHVLPDWLKDNDYLLHGHRPPMPSFRACFRSTFRIHTETVNIWSHLLGLILFAWLGALTLLRPNSSFAAPLQEKLALGAFFLGVELCLGFSWVFHTVNCHSEGVSRAFAKLDYSGIALLTVGSFVPLLYYCFRCAARPRVVYTALVGVLGAAAVTVSQCDRFSTPAHRLTRAAVFAGLGLSGVAPTLHYVLREGPVDVVTLGGQMGWFYAMGAVYMGGAALYAARVPERFLRGKCDIWFHSHQIFHLLVVAAAGVHFYGVSNLQEFHYGLRGVCAADNTTAP